LKKIPEALTVFGKAGQADTPTDPAPLSMFETIVALKPPNEWRRGMTWEKLLAEVNANIKTPGMANIFWMPIQTRTEMLTTGFRSVLGVKVFGPDLGEIQKLAVQVERELADVPNTRSAFAERTVGGYFLDFDVNREAAARYGLKVGDVNDIVESAIGGKNITTTVEGPNVIRSTHDMRAIFDRTSMHSSVCLCRRRPARRCRSLSWPTFVTRPVRLKCAAKTANRSALSLSILHQATSTVTFARRLNASRRRFSFRPDITFNGPDNSNTSRKHYSGSKSSCHSRS
jgi:hypothetical protein